MRRITIATVVAMLAGVLSAAPALAQDIPEGVAFEGYSAPFNAPCPVGADGTGSISDTANDGWCDLMVRGAVTQADITPQGIANTYSRGDFTWVEINVSLASGVSTQIEVFNGQSTYYLTVTQSGARRNYVPAPTSDDPGSCPAGYAAYAAGATLSQGIDYPTEDGNSAFETTGIVCLYIQNPTPQPPPPPQPPNFTPQQAQAACDRAWDSIIPGGANHEAFYSFDENGRRMYRPQDDCGDAWDKAYAAGYTYDDLYSDE